MEKLSVRRLSDFLILFLKASADFCDMQAFLLPMQSRSHIAVVQLFCPFLSEETPSAAHNLKPYLPKDASVSAGFERQGWQREFKQNLMGL